MKYWKLCHPCLASYSCLTQTTRVSLVVVKELPRRPAVRLVEPDALAAGGACFLPYSTANNVTLLPSPKVMTCGRSSHQTAAATPARTRTTTMLDRTIFVFIGPSSNFRTRRGMRPGG